MQASIKHSMLTPNVNALFKDQLNAILANATNIKKNVVLEDTEHYWNDRHYSLDQSSFFKNLNSDKKQKVLHSLNQKTLHLSYFIEKFGLNYGAQMILNAETTEEKSLYSVFGAEEVQHRLMLEPFITTILPENINFHPLLPVLALALEKASQQTLVFAIQVVLEGFGLFHYSYLRESCQNTSLKNVFDQILKDEVQHHGMGVCLTANMDFTNESKEQITELTALIVRALIEAEWVASEIELAHGGFTKEQKNKFRNEISWEPQIQKRIERLKGLMKKVGYAGLSEDLEKKGIYRMPLA